MDAGGCPTVLVNGFPVMCVGRDSAGGVITGPGADGVLAAGAVVSLVGDGVVAHGRGEHGAAVVLSGSADVFAAPASRSRAPLDEDALASLGGVLGDVWAVIQGAWSAISDIAMVAMKHPKEAAALFLLCAMFPQLGVALTGLGLFGAGFEFAEALVMLVEARTPEEREAALKKLGSALANTGLSVGPQLLGALKKINPAMLARAGKLLGGVMSAKGGARWPALVKAIKELWNDDALKAIRGAVPDEVVKPLPGRSRELRSAKPQEIPGLLQRHNIREQRVRLNPREQANYNATLGAVVNNLPPGSNIDAVRAYRGGQNVYMAVQVDHATGKVTLLINVDVDYSKLAAMIRSSPISNYKVTTGQGVFRTESLSDADLIRFTIWHEVAHARFAGTRRLEVLQVSKATSWNEVGNATRHLDAASRTRLEDGYRLFHRSRHTLAQNFTNYSAMTPQEFFAEYNAALSMGLPIHPDVTRLYGSLFGRGGAFQQTQGP
jgi:hypothetical protein